jgi:hypothetical protein
MGEEIPVCFGVRPEERFLTDTIQHGKLPLISCSLFFYSLGRLGSWM